MESEAAVSVEKLVKVYLRIKQKRSELSAEYEAQDAKLQLQSDKIKKALLAHCKEHDVESVRTAEGMFYRSVRTNYWTSDWESLHKFVLEHGVPELLEKRIHQTNIKQFLQDNPDLLPPGLNVDSEYTVTVRKK
ncbi:MAG: hypothetical protein EBR82_27045 [Caulobacteraceae bacterium]|nr:hypothetical protein [Caulobacteraceae bacterium]